MPEPVALIELLDVAEESYAPLMRALEADGRTVGFEPLPGLSAGSVGLVATDRAGNRVVLTAADGPLPGTPHDVSDWLATVETPDRQQTRTAVLPATYSLAEIAQAMVRLGAR